MQEYRKMISIKKGIENRVIVTITQNQSAETPKYFLFSFIHTLSKEVVRFYMTSTVESNNRYDEYTFTEVSGTATPVDALNGYVSFKNEGQWYYSVYEMPTKTLDPSTARQKVEEGRALIYPNVEPVYFNPYISSNEDNNNFVYLD